MNKRILIAPTLFFALTVAGCDQAGSSKAPTATPAATPAQPAKAPVVNPVDALALNLATDKYQSQSGELVDGQLGNNGKDGFLLYGPYASFQPGTYTVTFTGKVDELPDGAKVRLDADADKGKTILSGIDATTVGNLPGFEFTLPQAVGDLEIRVFAKGGAKVSVTGYQVAKKG